MKSLELVDMMYMIVLKETNMNL